MECNGSIVGIIDTRKSKAQRKPKTVIPEGQKKSALHVFPFDKIYIAAEK